VLRASQGFIYSLTTWKLRKKKATHEETKPATFPHIQIIVYTVSHTKVCAHVVIILYIYNMSVCVHIFVYLSIYAYVYSAILQVS
jgi:hypothetical protein